MPVTEPEPSRIEVNALVHATEDEEKVIKAIRQLFQDDIWHQLKIEKKRLRGHFHNPILRLTVTLQGADQVQKMLESLGTRVSSSDRAWLQQNFALHCNKKGQIFLRFDKQESYQGRLRLVDRGDSLRTVIRITGRKPSINTLQTVCKRFNLL